MIKNLNPFPYEIDQESVKTLCMSIFKNESKRWTESKDSNVSYKIVLEILSTGSDDFKYNNTYAFDLPRDQHNIKTIKRQLSNYNTSDVKQFLDDFLLECNESSSFGICKYKKNHNTSFRFANVALVPLDGFYRFVLKIYDEVFYYDVPNDVMDQEVSNKPISSVILRSTDFYNNVDEDTHYGHKDFIGEDKVEEGLKGKLDRVRGYDKAASIERSEDIIIKEKAASIDNRIWNIDNGKEIMETPVPNESRYTNELLLTEPDVYAKARKETQEAEANDKFIKDLPKGQYSNFVEDPDEPGSMIPRSTLEDRHKLRNMLSKIKPVEEVVEEPIVNTEPEEIPLKELFK